MVPSIFLIIFFSITLIYLSLLIYSKEFWLTSLYEKQSVGRFNSNGVFKLKQNKQKFLDTLGQMIYKLMPNALVTNFKKDLVFLGRNLDEFYISCGLLGISFAILISCFVLSHNFIYLLIFTGIIVMIFGEIKISAQKSSKEIENNLDHLVKCLKVLIVKTETPLLTALELVIQDWGTELKDLKRELNKLIERAKKSGIKKTLIEWDTNLDKFQNLISLLLSIHEGASKLAIEENINKFLAKYQEEKNQKLAAAAENLQLYLIAPIILILLISLIPMIDAINFYMKNTGVI